MNAVDLKEIDPPIGERVDNFGAADTFRPDSREVARRAIYLAWAYREIWEQFTFPAGREATSHVAELGAIFLEIIGGDMRDLYEAAELPPIAERCPPSTAAEALIRTAKSVRERARYEDIKQAFDLLHAERAREAGHIPLDLDGRPGA